MIYDLSIPLTRETIPFPGSGEPPMAWEKLANHGANQFQLSLFSMTTHLGTHVDAPLHFFENGRSTAQIDLGRYCGRAVCIEVPDFPETGIFRLEHALEKNRELLIPGDILILRTGWETRLGTPEYFKFPDFHASTGAVMEKYGIISIGTDLPSIDNTGDAHRSVLGREMGLIESLINLKPLIGKRFFFSAVPLKFAEGDGSPVRAYALTDD